MANVPIDSLNPLIWVKEVPQNLVENFDIREHTGRVGTLDSHQAPFQTYEKWQSCCHIRKVAANQPLFKSDSIYCRNQ
jgi:hypothetical protein